MHTSRLDPSLFDPRQDGRSIGFDAIFPGWHRFDRFGIVVHAPLGAVGASLLVQAAATAFYALDPARRDERPQYPEIYLFHVGEPHGEHLMLDFLPVRKEVVVAADPTAIVEAVNDRGITRLAVPDGSSRPLELPGQFGWAERHVCEDRLASAFAYSPAGRTRDADLAIHATTTSTEENAALTIDVERVLARYEGLSPEQLAASVEDRHPYSHESASRHRVVDFVTLVQHSRRRIDEVGPDVRDAVAARRGQLLQDGLAVETYRRISPAAALELLAPAPAGERR